LASYARAQRPDFRLLSAVKSGAFESLVGAILAILQGWESKAQQARQKAAFGRQSKRKSKASLEPANHEN
jgi:hypothetical protein